MNSRYLNGARRAFVIGGGALLLAGVPFGAAARTGQRRVIVVGGALAEIVYALDAQSTPQGVLVATDTTCTFPAAASALPKVGYQRALSAEGLLSLRPDLILASSEAGPPGALSQVKQAGRRSGDVCRAPRCGLRAREDQRRFARAGCRRRGATHFWLASTSNGEPRETP